MRPLAACLLLTAFVLPAVAADGQSSASTMAAHGDDKSGSKVVDHAVARSAASAAVSNSKSEPKWSDKKKAETAEANAKAGAKDEARSEAKAAKKEHKVKADDKAALEPATGRDQSVCDLSPHPSWCDQ